MGGASLETFSGEAQLKKNTLYVVPYVLGTMPIVGNIKIKGEQLCSKYPLMPINIFYFAKR